MFHLSHLCRIKTTHAALSIYCVGVEDRGVANALVFDLLDPSSSCIVYIKTPPGDVEPSSPVVRIILSSLLMDNSSYYDEKNDDNEEKRSLL